MDSLWEESFTNAWKTRVQHELTHGKERLTWITSLSESFCSWVENISFFACSPLAGNEWFLFGTAHNKTVVFQLSYEPSKDILVFHAKREYSSEENRFIYHVLTQIPFSKFALQEE